MKKNKSTYLGFEMSIKYRKITILKGNLFRVKPIEPPFIMQYQTKIIFQPNPHTRYIIHHRAE